MADLDVARRAVAAAGWRWRKGMTDTAGCCVVSDGDGGLFACRPDGSTRECYILGIPDLDDPATIGCLMALAQEHGNDAAFEDACVMIVMHGLTSAEAAAALVTALEVSHGCAARR